MQRERVFLALVEDRPTFTPMYRDERVNLARYNREIPAVVATEIEVAADLFARLFEGLSPDQLARTCIYRYPAPAERDLSWMGHHTLHEAQHHLRDIELDVAQR